MVYGVNWVGVVGPSAPVRGSSPAGEPRAVGRGWARGDGNKHGLARWGEREETGRMEVEEKLLVSVFARGKEERTDLSIQQVGI